MDFLSTSKYLCPSSPQSPCPQLHSILLTLRALGVETLSREVTAITAEALKAAEDDEDIDERAPHFGLFFTQLRRLLCDNAPPQEELISSTSELTLTAPESAPSNQTGAQYTSDSISFTSIEKKRPNSLTISPPSAKKLRPTVSENTPQTPDQPTVSPNPTYSGDSRESVDEDNTKQMIRTFIRTTFYHLGRDFRRISWPSYAQKCRLDVTGFFENLCSF